MIVDFADGSAPVAFATDVCIVGAGVAGITLARTLAHAGLRICLLESGGLDGECQTQALCTGESGGDVPFDAWGSRMRVFGGSCTLWGGGCMPLEAMDFERRPWVAHSGWPFPARQLAPWYLEAREICGIARHPLQDGRFVARTRHPLPVFGDDGLANRVFIRSPQMFGRSCRAELEAMPGVTVLLHATVLELEAAADGCRISGARIGSLGGRRGRVRAAEYVLASGGIENARLLLLSDRSLPGGIGNHHDQVGRCFMDHPSCRLGTVHSPAAGRLAQAYDRDAGTGPVPAFAEVGLSAAAQEGGRLLNARTHPFRVEGPAPRGLHAVRVLRSRRRRRPDDEDSVLQARLCEATRGAAPAPWSPPADTSDSRVRLALEVVAGAGGLACALARRLAGKAAVPAARIDLVGYFEQAPNPESRVRLGSRRDAFGQRQVRVEWRFTGLDRRSQHAAGWLFGSGLARACKGRFEPEPWLQRDDQALPDRLYGSGHHLGTTRMADDPRAGVVDRHCRVHGMDNLHIAGSSVFPTGGWAFPTFTIIALALRLAERLRLRLAA